MEDPKDWVEELRIPVPEDEGGPGVEGGLQRCSSELWEAHPVR